MNLRGLMTRSFSLLAPLLFLSLLFIACEEDPASSDTHGSLTVTIDGTARTFGVKDADNDDGDLEIIAEQIDAGITRQLTISIKGAEAVKYTLGGSAVADGRLISYLEGEVGNLNAFSSISGSVDISSISDSGATGTFNTVVKREQGSQTDTTTINMTVGSFNVTF